MNDEVEVHLSPWGEEGMGKRWGNMTMWKGLNFVL
jgi:hypothetical protein